MPDKCPICHLIAHGKEHNTTLIHVVPIGPRDDIAMYQYYVNEMYDEMREYMSGVDDYEWSDLCPKHIDLMHRKGFWIFPQNGIISEPKEPDTAEAKA